MGCRSYEDMRNHLAKLTDSELMTSLKALVMAERSRCVDILKHLNEMDRRKVAENSGFPSLFEYCVRELRYVNGTAARLIHAARAAKKYEILYKSMGRGLLSVTTVSMLAPRLTWANHRRLVRAAAGKSAREVEALVASLNPVAAAPAERIRILTVASPPAPVPPPDELFASSVEAESKNEIQAVEAPMAPAAEAANAPASAAPPPPPVRRAHFSFTADEDFLRDYERAKELSRHKWPAGNMEDVFGGAIKVLLEKIDPDRRKRRKDRGRRLLAGARSRHIPAAVKDEVWRRDGGRCVYESPEGRACGARANLEFDHVRPWALGGGSGDAANVRLLCRVHNMVAARGVFGAARIDAAVARRRDACGTG